MLVYWVVFYKELKITEKEGHGHGSRHFCSGLGFRA